MICILCGKEIVGNNYGRNAGGYTHESCCDVGIMEDTNEENKLAGSKAKDYWFRLEGAVDVSKRPHNVIKKPDIVSTEPKQGLIESVDGINGEESGIQSDDSITTGDESTITDDAEPIIA